jgi:SHS2 domain-containing protein
LKDTDGKAPFRELDHTADLRVEVQGKDEPDLFRNAVKSLYILLGLPEPPDRREAVCAERLEIHGEDAEEALVALLGELLYKAGVERRRLNLRELSVRSCVDSGGGYTVVLGGDWQDVRNADTAGEREIKAVTYHDVQIRRTPGGWSARIVMDL